MNETSRFFLCRLIPPRRDFARTMSDAERGVMQNHVAYWTGHLNTGTAIVFGPVADPAGDWGVGIIAVEDEDAVRALEAADPAIRSGLGFRYEILPMPGVMARP